jgi:hypothetical protein
MSKSKVLVLLLINFTLLAKNPGFFPSEKNEVGSSQSVNKPVVSFKSSIDMVDMLIDDSWTNFSKIKSYAMQNLGGIKSASDIIIKIEEVPFLSNGRDAKLIINVNSSGDKKGEIRSYYFRLNMTYEEIVEFEKDYQPTKYYYTYGNIKVELKELNNEIGMKDLTGVIRYSSVKSTNPDSNNVIYYPPFLNVIIAADHNNPDLFNVTFFSSPLNNYAEIEKINAEPGQQDFHKNVRRIVEAVKSGKITNSEFAGDEIKKFYQKTVLGEAHWGSFPGKRFISKIQLAGTSGSFIAGGDRSFHALIGRGDNNYFSNEIKNWVNYLSYALGRNYIAVKKYDQANLLSSVSFIPVNQDFNVDAEIVAIELEITKNIFLEDGKGELLLSVYTPLFGFSKYENYWVPMLEMYDWN